MEQPRSSTGGPLNLSIWFANVILPVYAGMQVAVGAMKFGGLFEKTSSTISSAMRALPGSDPVLLFGAAPGSGSFFVD